MTQHSDSDEPCMGLDVTATICLLCDWWTAICHSLSAAEELWKRYDWLAQPVSTCLINSSTPLDSSISVMIGCTLSHHHMHSFLASSQHHWECLIGAAAGSGSDTSALQLHTSSHPHNKWHAKSHKTGQYTYDIIQKWSNKHSTHKISQEYKRKHLQVCASLQ